MGQASSTLQPAAPSQPYKGSKSNKRRRWKVFLLSSSQREPQKLISLILLQDWQKVLVRAKLYPHEIFMAISLQLYDLPLRLFPLHLACALDPPVAVVSLFLKLHPDAASTAIEVIDKNKPSRTVRRPFRALRKYRRLAGSSHPILGPFRDKSWRRRSESQSTIQEQRVLHDSTNDGNRTNGQEQSLLNGRPMTKSKSSRWLPFRNHSVPVESGSSSSLWNTDYGDESRGFYGVDGPSQMGSLSGSSVASSSRQSSYLWNSSSSSALHQKGVILQLSPSGGISPFPIGSQETDSLSENLSQGGTLPSTKPLFCVLWDLMPLWEAMANATSAPDNSLLPCHLAVLYQASPAVLKHLIEVHPMGAVSSVLGMLPLHMACAGWVLEPWVAPPPPPPTGAESLPNSNKQTPLQPYHHHHQEQHPSRLKEILTVLLQALPQSLRIRSGNHGMTPSDYISEAMEEGPIKQECLSLLTPQDVEENVQPELASAGPLGHLTELASSPSLIFMDSYEALSPEIPLEIHCASSGSSATTLGPDKNASLLSFLLMAQDWEGALSLAEDKPTYATEWFYGCGDRLDPTIEELHPGDDYDVWRRTALHSACRYRAPVGLVKVLVEAYPVAVTSPDPHCGSLPVHLACRHKSSYRVVKLLLSQAPATSKAVDIRGRLPLHHAVLAKAHYAIVELLVEIDPSAVLAIDKDNRTPLDLAKGAYGPKSAVVVRLLEMVTLVLTKKKVVALPAKPKSQKLSKKSRSQERAYL